MTIRFRGLENKTHRNVLFRFCGKLFRTYKPLSLKGEISVIFVSDRKIRKINRIFLNHDRVTDVIAFGYRDSSLALKGRGCPEGAGEGSAQRRNPHPGPLLFKERGSVPDCGREVLPFGDIYVSIDAARRQAKRGGYPLVRELALLLLHGLLHLTGFDDRTPSQRKRMFLEQARLFGKVDPRLAPPDFKGSK